MDQVALSKLSIAEREQLLKLARSKLTHKLSQNSNALPPLEPTDRSGLLPLSNAQQRLWFMTQLDPGASEAYHMPIGLRLAGRLDRDALVWALNRLVERHETLRTTFTVVNGEPRQRIAASQPFSLTEFDVGGETDPEARVRSIIAAEAVLPYDVEHGPLIRGVLIRESEERHVLLINQHHIVSDGWSMGIIVNEVCALYGARFRGMDDPLPPLRIQYADYAAWQRGWFNETMQQRQVDYWTRVLASAPEVIHLPSDRPRPAQQNYEGGSVDCELGSELTRSLRELSQRHGTTLFMTLMAGWAALISRLSGQQDIVIGTPSANRSHRDVEPLVGFFVNMLALRFDLSGVPTVSELLAQVKQRVVDAQNHQDLPFEQVVEQLNPIRSLAFHPIFQLAFAWQNVPKSGDMRSVDVGMTTLQAPHATARFDLLLSLNDNSDSIAGKLEYSTSLFDASTVERYLAQWRIVLAGMVADDLQSIERLPLLTDDERKAVLHDWNRVAAAGDERPVHAYFEQWAARTPDAIALKHDDIALSYSELNRRANQLARHLRNLGVGADDRVALCFERGVAKVLAILAVFKAGAGYVPLDPAYPAERLNYVLDDSAPKVMLTDSGMGDRWTASGVSLPFALIEIDRDGPWSHCDNSDLSLDAIGWKPEHLAYVIYTSGSTGKPKGVMIEHRSISRLFVQTEAWYGFHERDVWPLFHSYAFDVAVWEMWGALRHGGRLLVIDLDTARSPDEFYRLVCREGVTVLNQTPSAFRQFDQAQPASSAEHNIRYVIFAGEALEVASLRAWYGRARNDRTQLVNMYGITEGTVHCTYYAVQREDVERIGPSPIGERIPDLRTYILDKHRQPVPIGVTGELYVGGPGIARGYLNRPDLTAERFIGDPFCTEPGARLYRTGDLARWRADGGIEYQGRNDFQVKIRGFRIELGEIEARLHAHAMVREVAVIAREDQPGEKQLVAYVALDEDYAVQLPVSLDQTQVAGWEDLYDTTYSGSTEAEALSDFVGWNSSYTAQPLPLEEMRHWRNETVARIQALKPRRVLEIGCGTGLLLLQLAGECERYLGTDLSRRSLIDLERKVAEQRLGGVALLHARADDFAQYGEDSFDTIILNSVVQYFPSIEYLQRVIDGVLRLLAPGGSLFIGDVRNRRLLEAFHASVQRYRGAGGDKFEDLRERTRRAVEAENELLIDPAYFATIADRRPGMHLQVLLKAGPCHNELSQFRYDVVLRSDDRRVADSPHALEWAGVGSLKALHARLATGAHEVLLVNGVPNSRLAFARDTLRGLHDLERSPGERVPDYAAAGDRDGVDPQAFLEMAAALGWRAEPSWAGGDESGDYCVFLYPPSHAGAGCDHRAFADTFDAPLRAFANDPLRSIKRARIADALRASLQIELPAYMVPAHIMLIDHLPLTANGKLDRRALPPPEAIRSEAGYVAPRTPVEQAMAEIWASVLKIDRVGIHDNFFALGGDSILTVAIIAKSREQGVALRIEHIFKYQSIAALADSGLLATDIKANDDSDDADLRLETTFPEGIEDVYGLAALQLGMIYHGELSQSAGIYHDVFSFHLRLRQWNLANFRVALAALTRKHPILRTSIDLHGTEPMQRVHWDAEIPVIIEDLSHLTPEACDANIAAFIEGEKGNGFDLDQAPLVRVFIHQRGEHEIQYSLSFHHAMLDGWSVAAFHAELFREYLKVCASGDAMIELPPLASSFKSMVAAEQLALASPQARKFWAEHLADWSPSPLPSDLDERGVAISAGLNVDIPAALKNALVALAAESSVPLRTLLLAAHLRVVATFSGVDDVTTGVVSHARREERDGADVLGMFLNTLPHRQLLAGGSWRELIRQTFENELAITPYRAYPYFQLYLDNGRVGYHDVVFNYVNFHVLEGLEASGEIELLASSGAGATNFEMALTAVLGADALSLGLEYDSGRFSRTRARQFLDAHITMLQAMVVAPETSYWSVDCLPSGEQKAPASASPEPSAARMVSVVQAFEAWAARAPDRIAAYDGEDRLSYAQLNARANRLARHLCDIGVRADDRVALCLERGLPMLVAILATLKAGGAYVPLDPACPPQRLAMLLEDSAPRALLTRGALGVHWDDMLREPSFAVVELDADEAWSGRSSGDLAAVSESDLAYVIYTSGSTGQPKGVMVEHGALARRMQALGDLYGFAESDRILQFSSPSFDASVEEIFGAWSHGATLVLRDDNWLDACSFWSLCASAQITVVDLPTRFWGSLARECEVPIPTCVRLAIVGGEAMEPAMLDAWLCRTGHQPRLLNTYGPTEAIVVATAHAPGEGRREAACIGRSIAGARTYVLDARGRPVPTGVCGELCLGGELARGYLNLPQLTRDRFVPDPFAAIPGARMYKTGDLARFRADGALEYLGRNDQQVKLRGFRIELGEIEARLSALLEVAEVAAVVHEDAIAGQRLVAYVVPRTDTHVSAQVMRDALARSLPGYMIPGAFVSLEALPLTPSGKLDRAALPPPDRDAMATRMYEAPVGETEQAIANVWRDLLGIEEVGRRDHFFESGGHSLLAIKLVYALKARFGRQLPLAAVFASPTLADLAAAVDDGQLGFSLLVPLQTMEQGRPMFCLHPVGGQTSFYRALALRLAGVCPVYGVQSPEMVACESADSVEAMAALYSAAIRSMQPKGPYRLLGWSSGGTMAMAVAVHLIAHGSSVDYLGLIDTRSVQEQQEADEARFTAEAVWLELRGAGYAAREANLPTMAFTDWLVEDFATVVAALGDALQPALTVEAFEHLKAQVPITRRHLALLARHRSQRVVTPLQVFRAIAGGGNRAATEWAGAAQTIAVEADHYGVLAEPHVAQVAAAIAAFIAPGVTPSVPSCINEAAAVVGEAEGAPA